MAESLLDKIKRLVNDYWSSGEKDAFMALADAVQPEMLRGPVNAQRYGDDSLVHTEAVHLALVYRDMKPMCMLATRQAMPNDAILPSFFDELDLSAIEITLPGFQVREAWLVYRHRAKEAMTYASYLNRNGTAHDPCGHFIDGYYLGYPFEDVVYFHLNRWLAQTDGPAPSDDAMPQLVEASAQAQ